MGQIRGSHAPQPLEKHTMAKGTKELIKGIDNHYFLRDSNHRTRSGCEWHEALIIEEAGRRTAKDAKGHLKSTMNVHRSLRYVMLMLQVKASNVENMVRRVSSILQAQHLPRIYSIIATLDLYPAWEQIGITKLYCRCFVRV